MVDTIMGVHILVWVYTNRFTLAWYSSIVSAISENGLGAFQSTKKNKRLIFVTKIIYKSETYVPRLP